MTAHLRLNAIYWGLTSLCVMNRKDALDKDEVIDFVMSCWDEEAGSLLYLSDFAYSPLTHCHRSIRESPGPRCPHTLDFECCTDLDNSRGIG